VEGGSSPKDFSTNSLKRSENALRGPRRRRGRISSSSPGGGMFDIVGCSFGTKDNPHYPTSLEVVALWRSHTLRRHLLRRGGDR